SSGTIPQYGYTGREPDATGLTFYRARYYHPGIGRFASRDPMGMADAVSPYAYVRNNPINLIDPMGWFALTPELLQNLMSGGSYVDFNVGTQVAMGPAVVGLGMLPGRAIAPPPPGTPGYQGMQGRSAEEQLPTTPSNAPGSDLVGQIGGFVNGALEGLNQAIISPGEFINWATGGLIFKSNVRDNNDKGKRAEAEVAADLEGAGRKMDRQVRKDTPFGPRVIDIEVKDKDGNVLGGVEVKSGDSRYRADQRSKDEWLRQNGYPVDVVRKP
ncbi:MAG: RHS repeat-associated core domain-containing protein, partial [Sulfuritalea sp.]|nr:RHS repeat-associated core domain-containing protein [Sulfuritalea sp.]